MNPSGRLTFDRYTLDPAERLLTRDGAPVELSGRYLDALVLLAGEAGSLVSKDRFLDEVWRGVPVTDEALTQCIRTLRRILGDSATAPRFIETVPKHGYRFIAPVVPDAAPAAPVAPAERGWGETLLLGAAGTAGAAVAGIAGGLVYGFASAAQPVLPGTGATSVVVVLMSLCLVTALLGGAGVAFGIALAARLSERRWRWAAAGGALGGLVVGGAVKLLGIDAFDLLFGRAPVGIAGAAEGLLLGASVGLGGYLGDRFAAGSPGRRLAAAVLAGGAGGVVVALTGGRLMAGSLALLAERFPEARFRLDRIAAFAGEDGFGAVSRLLTAGLEGALFGGCLIGAMVLAERRFGERTSPRSG